MKSLKFLIVFALCSFGYVQARVALDIPTFVAAFYKNPEQMGTFAPCSRFVARELGRYVQKGEQGKYYLELGCGTGNVTETLAKDVLKENDHLDAIELNPKLAAIAQERLAKYPNVTVHCCSALDWSTDVKYAGVFSTLPFNIFSVDLVNSILSHVKTMMEEIAAFSYVEYALLGNIKRKFLFGERHKNFEAMYSYLEHIRQKYLFDHHVVYRNLPPLHVYHLRFDNEQSPLV